MNQMRASRRGVRPAVGTSPTDRRLAVGLFVAIAVGLAFLARGLPSRTFFVGDPGVKLIVVRNAIEHPARPLDIDLPVVGGQVAPFLDPFFQVHGNHAHATTSQLFPLMSAPLVAVLGIRGAFVLPAVGFLIAIAAIALVGATLDPRRSLTWLILVAAAGTPLLFYGLEFWEHAPAVALAAVATLILIRGSTRSALGSGVLLGLAVLLRPEAAWYAAALLVSSVFLPARPRLPAVAAAIAGGVTVCLPLTIYTTLHTGHVFGGHISTNLSGLTIGWWAARGAITRSWLLLEPLPVMVVCALVAGLAIGWERRTTWSDGLRLAAVLLCLALAIAAARGAFPLASVWSSAPMAVLSLSVVCGPLTGDQRFLFTALGLDVLFVMATAPNDGGGQWGPRYLLFASIPAVALTVDTLQAVAGRWRLLGVIASTASIVASLAIQRNAYKELQGAKRAYERVVQLIERDTVSGSDIVTDVWWLDQVTACLYPYRVVMFVDTPGAARRLVSLLDAAATTNVSGVESGIEDGGASLRRWLVAAGRHPGQPDHILEPALEIYPIVR
jgi:hypothetical protein